MNLNFTLGEELILDTALQQVTGDGQPQLFQIDERQSNKRL